MSENLSTHSNRQQATAVLQERETILRLLAENTHDLVCLHDADGLYLYVSPSFERLLGYTADEVIGTDPYALFHPEDRQRILEESHKVALEGQFVSSIQYRMRQKSGTYIWLETYTRPVLDKEGNVTHLVTSSRDITEHRQAEEEIRKLNAELEQRVRQRTAQLEAANKELEAFTYSVSHDLRAPLRAIHGFSRILVEEYASELPPAAQRYLQIVQDNTQQMGKLIDDLLTFSRLSRQSLNKETVYPATAVEQALQALHHEQENREVTITIGTLPPCQADPGLLKQVYVNLLSNALKYTGKRHTANIEIGYRETGDRGAYFVKDNGVGFDMAYAHKLFDVFQRLHRAEDYGGTGVGLAIVQRIIHRHGGEVWAEGEVDEGATFYFSL